MDANIFWNITTHDLKQGYQAEKDTYTCILCGETFHIGVIYTINNTLLEAKKAIETHVSTVHPNIFEFYLNFGRVYTGLSDGQAELAKLFYKGYSDKEIVKITDANSISTIRNQRFAIREKYKQAKILVTLVELMEEKMLQLKQETKAEKLVDFHPKATCIDERYAITEKEKDEVLGRYFKNGELVIKNFPVKEKRKIIIMQKIMEAFETGKNYSEKEVNEILQRYYEDYVTVRRYLIQYGFMDRGKTGESYWVNTHTVN